MVKIWRRSSKGTKLLASLAVLGITASMAGLGTFASFTSSTSANHSVASGSLTIALGATGSSTNRLTVNASNIAPGDTIQRSFDLTNSGTVALAAALTLTTTASPSSVLPSSAGDTFQSRSSTITYAFAATQRSGTNQ